MSPRNRHASTISATDAASSSDARPGPLSTYRLQLNAAFDFDDATAVVPYLASLGISDIYLSPIFAATPGSTHGYDVVDYSSINEELGGREGFDRLSAAVNEHGIHLVLDFVPNHMGIGVGSNPWWQDVLENGQASPHAQTFDIDWNPIKTELQDKVLVPILGDYFGLVLERGELVLNYADGAFTVNYYDNPLPVAPPTYPLILTRVLERCEAHFESEALPLLELKSITGAFERLPPNSETDPELVTARRDEQLVTKLRLATLINENDEIDRAIHDTVTEINGVAGKPETFDALEALLNAQSYRPAFWRVAAEEINYRRFFAINQLAAIRQEAPGVFKSTHELLKELIQAGAVQGVRIDHPDGLWDPEGYFDLLAQVCPVWTVIEKIVEPAEAIPPDWAVDGTVGYEFARVTTELFVDSQNRKPIEDAYVRYIGSRIRFHELVYENKKLIMNTALASETNVLARRLDRLTEHNRRTRDFTLNSLRSAMREVIACFPIYRTYATCGEAEVSERSARFVETAVAEALRRNPAADPEPFRFLRDVLLMKFDEDATVEQQAETCDFVMKFQQLTGPVMAKGLEDTAFYIYNRLISLNEVGGDPASFGSPVSAFHRECRTRAQHWPMAMLTSSTHDTKRSEDVRARISALSEMPSEWKAAVNRWTRLNRRHRTRLEGRFAPHRNDEYHLYQTLVGIWEEGPRPSHEFVTRVHNYMVKVLREGQVSSSWVSPNEAYENAMTKFIDSILSPKSKEFLQDLSQFAARVSVVGCVNSLSQQVLKLTAPGVPDIYQGTEAWSYSLVDPDNRRPVAFERHREMLARLDSMARDTEEFRQILSENSKLFVTASLLRHRQSKPDLYREGIYEPLDVCGPQADRVVAFRRAIGDTTLVVIAPRLIAELVLDETTAFGDFWSETSVAIPQDSPSRYKSVLTGTSVTTKSDGDQLRLQLDSVFAELPVAVLMSENKIGDRL